VISTTCSAYTLGVIFFWGYVVFALRSGRVYGNTLTPTRRSENPFSYWFMVTLLVAMAIFFSNLQLQC